MTQFQNPAKTRVLVVEDECLIRLNAIDFIEDAGYRVYAADSADAAMDTLEKRDDIGCVFTDVNMPGSMDGLELARLVGERWPTVGLIVTSGRQQATDRFPAGGVFIAKPYTGSQLIGKLRSVLGSRIRAPGFANSALSSPSVRPHSI